MTTWRSEWFDFDDAVYLNFAAEGLMPRVAVRAVEQAVAAKTYPHRVSAASPFDLPNRVRASIAALIGGHPDEVALTTGASSGLATLVQALSWRRGDEVLTAAGEFPLQYTTLGPLAEREGVALRVAWPSGRFLTAEDLIAALTPRTRLVSVSLVRFEDGSMLDAALLSAACQAQGTLLCLDVSQACGAVPIDVAALGADVLTGAGYKWLLGPYGTGFFWIKAAHMQALRPGPFAWMAMAGADDVASLRGHDPQPVAAARRWDTAEWSGAFNPNLAGLAASVALVEQIGPSTVQAHNHRLVERLFEGLPAGVTVASPRAAARRGPYGCFRGPTHEATAAMVVALATAGVVISLREGNIRVSPHLFNTEHDIDRVIEVISGVSAAR